MEQSGYVRLVELTDPRDFLRTALRLKSAPAGKINVAAFSKSAGFSSRSFVLEYLSGKKRLSQESLQKIILALKLPKDYGMYLRHLVLQDQPELRRAINLDLVQETANLREVIRRRHDLSTHVLVRKNIFRKRDALRVYASLGEKRKGAAILEIAKKTGLGIGSVQANLQALVDAGLVRHDRERFFALEQKLDFFNFKNAEFVDLIKDVTKDIGARAGTLVQNSDNLLFYSAASVKSASLPHFKERLRTALFEVMDEFQSDDGDCTQEVFLCLK